MSWVVLSSRKGELVAAIMRQRNKLLQISQKLMDLQQYGTNIADGIVTPNEFSTIPNAYMQRQLNYMGMAVPFAYNQAMQKTEMLKGGMMPGSMGMMMDPSKLTQQQVQMFFMDRFRTELENISRIEQKKINVEEKKLTQEKLQAETQLKALEAELETVKQSEDKSIKDNAIKLA